MIPSHLEDRIRWGLNVTARTIGATTSAYRPRGPAYPLATANRFLRLNAAFSTVSGDFNRANGYGGALWQGIFDAAYTQAGDYLVQHEATWFIASQDRLLPVLCVRTNQIVTFSRPDSQVATGTNNYGGITSSNVTPIMTQWPASVLVAARETRPLAPLPSDVMAASWTVLLPGSPGVILQTGDLMSDDIGRSGVVVATELTALGWRLAVRQATT